MAKSVVARGKALVALLRANPGVRDPEALAAYAGRVKHHRKAGLSPSKAMAAARKVGGGGGQSGGRPKPPEKKSIFAKKPAVDDDPFAEDFGPDEEKSKEDKQLQAMEARLIREMEKADRAKVYRAIQEQGGLKSRAALREEYAGIPNTFKRKDGLGGDEMADHLATYFPELGIESERDLIDYLAA